MYIFDNLIGKLFKFCPHQLKSTINSFQGLKKGALRTLSTQNHSTDLKNFFTDRCKFVFACASSNPEFETIIPDQPISQSYEYFEYLLVFMSEKLKDRYEGSYGQWSKGDGMKQLRTRKAVQSLAIAPQVISIASKTKLTFYSIRVSSKQFNKLI